MRDLRIGRQRDSRPYVPQSKVKASELLAAIISRVGEGMKQVVLQTVDQMCREGQIIDDRESRP